MTSLERLTAKEASEELSKINGRGKWKRRNKFNAVRTIVGGVAFHSKREAKDWLYLKRRENAGEIHDLRRQVKYELFACAPDGTGAAKALTYIADFTWVDSKDGSFHVGDSKGCITAEFRIKKKMMLICHGIEVELM